MKYGIKPQTDSNTFEVFHYYWLFLKNHFVLLCWQPWTPWPVWYSEIQTSPRVISRGTCRFTWPRHMTIWTACASWWRTALRWRAGRQTDGHPHTPYVVRHTFLSIDKVTNLLFWLINWDVYGGFIEKLSIVFHKYCAIFTAKVGLSNIYMGYTLPIYIIGFVTYM